MLDWLYPDAMRALSPWLRSSVVAGVIACTGFMLVQNYPWPVLVYIDAVALGFGWALLFHIAADLKRAPVSGPSRLRSGGAPDAGHRPATAKQLTARGWQLFGASLFFGIAGMVALVLLFAGT